MKAIVLAAGHGKKMRGYAGETHKSMLPLGDGRPIIAHVVYYLLGFGFEPVVAVSSGTKGGHATGYLAANYPGRVNFSESDEPRGTALEVYHARAHLTGGTFLVYYGDVIADVNLAAMRRQHESQNNFITLCGFAEHELDKGVIYAEGDRVTKFIEKPKLTQKQIGGYINCPVFFAEPELLDFIGAMRKAEGVEFDFGRHVIPALIEDGKRIGLFVHHGYYYDIGDGKVYERALREGV